MAEERAPILTDSTQRFVLSMTVAFLVGSLVALLAFTDIPEHNATVLNVLVGNVTGFMGAIVAFYFHAAMIKKPPDEKAPT